MSQARPRTAAAARPATGAISAGVGRHFAILPRLRGRGPRALLVVTALDDIPARPPIVTLTAQGQPDVDNSRPQGRSHQDLRDQGRRYRFAGSAGGDPLGALQDPRQGQPCPAWIAQACVPASPTSRLPRPYRRSALQVVDRAAGYSPLKVYARRVRAF